MSQREFTARKEGGDPYVSNVATVVAPSEHAFSLTTEGANTIDEADAKFSGTSGVKIWIHAIAEDYVAGANSLTIKLYRGNNYVEEVVSSLVDVTAGDATAVDVSFDDLEYCDKAVITGTVTVPAGGQVDIFISKIGGSNSTEDEAAYNPTTGANRVEEIDPTTLHNAGPDHLVDELNQAASTYRNIFSMEDYKNASIHYNVSGGVTLTAWSANDDSADDSADTGWIDVSTTILGGASIVDSSGMAFLDTNIRVSRIMLKHITSDTSNATDIFIYKGN